MKKFIVTLTSGRFPCNYYVEVSDNLREFIFTPGFNSRDYPEFRLSVVNGHIECEGHPDPELKLQAEKEIESLLFNRIPDRIKTHIRNSFLGTEVR